MYRALIADRRPSPLFTLVQEQHGRRQRLSDSPWNRGMYGWRPLIMPDPAWNVSAFGVTPE